VSDAAELCRDSSRCECRVRACRAYSAWPFSPREQVSRLAQTLHPSIPVLIIVDCVELRQIFLIHRHCSLSQARSKGNKRTKQDASSLGLAQTLLDGSNSSALRFMVNSANPMEDYSKWTARLVFGPDYFLFSRLIQQHSFI